MYAFYKQIHPPTCVERAVHCQLFDHTEYNLVTAGVNQLNVYRFKDDIEHSGQKPSGKSEANESKGGKRKLEFVANYMLFGNISNVISVHLPGSSRDCLLLGFCDAKLSLVEFDPTTRDLKTSSLHYFEEEELKDGFCQRTQNVSLLHVDPEYRCAVLLVHNTKLVVLPFRKDVSADDVTADLGSRPPVMSSYIIDTRTLDERVSHILDVQFLHGYYEPTVLILYEPLPTWSGRVAVRKDSCSIVAISLNLQEQTHPIIWSLANLPFDSFMVHPVPKPIGGVLVFATNSLLYINQSFPPYGVSLNSFTDFSTEFLMRPQEGVNITLDCCQASFISHDRMVISLKGGELYLLNLVVDGMRAVRSFHLDKAAASVLTTCMCTCGEGYLFLGSRLGNSLLLKYTEKQLENVDPVSNPNKKDRMDEPPLKKKKDTLVDWIATDVSQLDDLDELEVYGSESSQPTSHTITQYMFEVCDSIMNIGPCGRAEMGEPAFLSEEFNSNPDPDLELVTTSGYGKNGALAVLQRSIRPQVVTTFELPGCTDMWTLAGPRNKDKVEEDDSSHALLILSRADSSMVLQTGEEIMELDQSGFTTDSPTLLAANLGEQRYILQVTPVGVRLLEGVNEVQNLPLDLGSPILTCSVADPYVILLTRDCEVLLLTLTGEGMEGEGQRLTASRPYLHQHSPLLTMDVYKDTSGLFTVSSTQNKEAAPVQPVSQSESVPNDGDESDKNSADDEDEMLYGDSDATIPAWQQDVNSTAEPVVTEETDDVKRTTLEPTYWLAVVRANGWFEIYRVPDMVRVYVVKNFPMGHKVLVDSMQSYEPTIKPSGSQDKVQQELPVVHELLLTGLGHGNSKPHLMARVDDDLFIYEVYSSPDIPQEGHLHIRFHKVPHGLLLHSKKARKARQMEGKDSIDHKHCLREFYDISGYSGVFVCGSYPHLLIMTNRGALRMHPMGIDGGVSCFTPFHNINCPKGFLYFNTQGELRISVLPTHLSYDAPWPVRKVPLRCSPHFVAYHPESKTYTVVSSTSEICKRVVRVAGDGEKEFDELQKDDRYIYPRVDKFSMQLFSPVSWEPIPNTKFELEDFEHVLCIKSVSLKSEGTLSGLKGYVAVGTNLTYNEDVPSRGRLIVFDVIDVVPLPGQPLTKNKMKIEYNKEQKGPVTALDYVKGFLVTAIGQKIYIWQLKDSDLSGIAFIDTQIYIHQISVLKNLLIVGDICKSMSLLRYQEDLKVLSLVSRDIRPLEVYSLAFMVDHASMAFLASDRLKNLLIYAYEPEVRESQGGQRLLRRADINVGSHVNSFFRVRCKVEETGDRNAAKQPSMRHVTFFASLDGSIGYLLPIPEKAYRRLSMLQNALNAQLPHTAGLNPKAYRQAVMEFRELTNLQRNVVDGDLVTKFLSLSLPERVDMAKRIGTSREQIEDDLVEIDRCTAHF